MSSVDLIIESVEVTILGEYGDGPLDQVWLLNQESGEKTNGKLRPLQYNKGNTIIWHHNIALLRG